MDPRPFQERILDDEGLTANLNEEDAMRLLAAVCHHISIIAGNCDDEHVVNRKIDLICRTTREIARSGATGDALIQQLSRIPL